MYPCLALLAPSQGRCPPAAAAFAAAVAPVSDPVVAAAAAAAAAGACEAEDGTAAESSVFS